MSQMIFKHIGIENESTYGISVAGNATRLTVRTANIALTPNKELVEDTMASVRGRERMTSLRNSIEGSITAFATPRNTHHFLEMAFGDFGTSAALGTSGAALVTYNQNTSGTWVSKTILKDYNKSQEKFRGTAATGLEFTFSDGLAELSLDVIGQRRDVGITLANSLGETIKPFTFSDFNVQIAAGASANGLTTIRVSELTLSYSNGIAGAYLSGNNNITRIDSLVPSVTGSFKIFHDNDTFRTATFGCSEYFLRVDATLPDCHGLISGITPYFLRIDVPRTQFTTSELPYEQASLSMETISFTGLLEPGVSYLIRAQQTVSSIL